MGDYEMEPPSCSELHRRFGDWQGEGGLRDKSDRIELDHWKWSCAVWEYGMGKGSDFEKTGRSGADQVGRWQGL
jgi:hypothetical protein